MELNGLALGSPGSRAPGSESCETSRARESGLPERDEYQTGRCAGPEPWAGRMGCAGLVP